MRLEYMDENRWTKKIYKMNRNRSRVVNDYRNGVMIYLKYYEYCNSYSEVKSLQFSSNPFKALQEYALYYRSEQP